MVQTEQTAPLLEERNGGATNARSIEVEALNRIAALERRMIAFETAHASMLREVSRVRLESARNLLHYLALRSIDIRELQDALSRIGLSSLGRAEAHALSSVRAVKSVLRRLLGADASENAAPMGPSLLDGHRMLSEHTEALLGPAPLGRRVRIMVTMPSEAADGPQLIEELVATGMDLMRINCAHDDERRWMRMIEQLAAARKRTGRPCKVLMDLAGPKLRTGPLPLGPGVIHWRPRRDSTGRPTGPARVWLHSEGAPSRSGADASLAVAHSWRARLEPGVRIILCDLRDRKRELSVVAADADGVWAESMESCYLGEGVELSIATSGRKRAPTTRIGKLPPTEHPLSLERGDTLVLTRALDAGRPALRDGAGRVLEPARIGCTLEAAFQCARSGESIWFDDGKIGGVVKRVDSDSMDVEITQMTKARSSLGSDKGINLPDTDLSVSGLTEKDLHDLDFVVQHSDAVGMSFVQKDGDVAQLEAALRQRRAPAHLGIVLKIETRRGFENLPGILLAAMNGRPFGVMIARGDLAVECGYERMAELQEEILWVSEAAHAPAIWATQVLESLAKKGVPSRAEITDAAMGERAECVMLNKGPHMVEAVRVLDDILRRMEAHQEKKSSRLRLLRLAMLVDQISPLEMDER